jgi:hypothetical protein
MTRLLLTLLTVTLTASASFACGKGLTLYSPFQRILHSDVSAFGTVTAIERDEVEQPAAQPNQTLPSFRVAVVRVDQAVCGLRNVTHLKVLFTGQQMWEGQELCLFVNRHPTLTGYYTPAAASPWYDRSNPQHANSWNTVNALLPVVSDPITALKEGDATDRFRAAALLTMRYRKAQTGVPADKHAEEPVDRDESHLILKALCDVDWDHATDGVSHWTPYLLLGLKANTSGFPHAEALNDGKGLSQHFGGSRNKFRDAFQQWVESDGSKFQVKKLVSTADVR